MVGKMKAFLINPPVYDFSAYDLWMKPLGFLLVARLLLKNNWKVYYFDFMDRLHPSVRSQSNLFGCGKFPAKIIEKPECYADVPRYYKRFGLAEEVFVEYIKSIDPPDFILLSSGMTYWYPGVKEVVQLCRRYFPGKPIVLGGIYASLCPQHAEKMGADFVFVGKDLVKFSQALAKLSGSQFQPYHWYELEPAWELYPKLNYICVRTSTGCPLCCRYCASHYLEPAVYQRKPEKMAEEITNLCERFDIADVAFYDDALLFRLEQHLAQILSRIHRKLRFHSPNGLHLRFFNPETAFLLKESGFRTIRLSLESVKPETVDSSHKVDFQKFEKVMDWLVKANFSKEDIGVYIMVGWPDQRPAEILETIRILKGYPCRIKLAEYSPIPFTSTFHMCEALYPDLNLEEPLFQNNSIFPVWNFPGKWEFIRQIKEMVKK